MYSANNLVTADWPVTRPPRALWGCCVLKRRRHVGRARVRVAGVTIDLRPQRFCDFLWVPFVSRSRGNSTSMLLILALLLVLLLFGVGFAVHFLWIVAVIFAVLWLVGVAIGRGEGAGRHHFYRW